jgi:hypothetical protein
MIAMDAENEEWTTQVGRNWGMRDGDVEGWICPTCGKRVATEMIAGVREDAKLLPVRDERDE